jgi:hypothetical protein
MPGQARHDDKIEAFMVEVDPKKALNKSIPDFSEPA